MLATSTSFGPASALTRAPVCTAILHGVDLFVGDATLLQRRDHVVVDVQVVPVWGDSFHDLLGLA